jgi:hypothetical protein
MAMSNRMTKIFFVIAVGALCFIYGFCTYGRTWQLEADHPLSHQNDFARQLAWRRKLTPSDNPGKIIRGRFIVVFNDAMLDDDDDVDALAEYVANVTGADVLWTYTEVIKGVAIEGVVSQSSLDAILQRDDIERVEQVREKSGSSKDTPLPCACWRSF